MKQPSSALSQHLGYHKMMQTDFNTELMIRLVRERPALWDKSREEHRWKDFKALGWRDVCQEMYQGFDDLSEEDKEEYEKFVMKKWKNVKDHYTKSVKRSGRRGNPGRRGNSRRPYIYHDLLTFMDADAEQGDAADLDRPHIEIETDLEYEDMDSYHPLGSVGQRSTGTHEEEEEEEGLKLEVVGEETGQEGQVRVLAPSRRREREELEKEILERLSAKQERHLSFYQSLLPSLQQFTEDETLQFQSAVITVIQNIKAARSFPG